MESGEIVGGRRIDGHGVEGKAKTGANAKARATTDGHGSTRIER
jgi:hypothetical protein